MSRTEITPYSTNELESILNNVKKQGYDITDEESLSVFLQACHSTMHEWKRLNAYYRGALMEVRTKFDVLNEQFSVEYDRNPIESIETRIKTPESLLGKLKRTNCPTTLEAVEKNICDVAGIRVICSFIEDVYLLAECIASQDDVHVIRVKDYIKNPKPNGYRSLHIIVEVPIFLHGEKRWMKVEVQLRTIAMNFWASLEHKMRYKKDINPESAKRLGADLYNCAEVAHQLDLKMQRIRREIDPMP
jgi:putative GTP pyrophosphokinase